MKGRGRIARDFLSSRPARSACSPFICRVSADASFCMSDELIVFVTAPDRESAAHIADALVTERLAACVSIVAGIESIYRWEGRIARDRETLLIIKTTEARFAELEQRVKQLHSYTTPEIIAHKIVQGSPEYLKWIRDSTTIEEAQTEARAE